MSGECSDRRETGGFKSSERLKETMQRYRVAPDGLTESPKLGVFQASGNGLVYFQTLRAAGDGPSVRRL